MPDMLKKIGIMGGTFDPIHYGHLIIAENAASQYSLDKVIFIPTGNPPHKAKVMVTDAAFRCEMVALAIRGNAKFELSKQEVEDKEICYTCRTLTSLKKQYPENEYYFIMGADSLFEFETWRQPQVICDKAVILVAARDDFDENMLVEKIEELKNKFHAKIFKLNSPNFEVSSKDIRQRIKTKKTTRYLLPEEVRDYIVKEKLYCS